MKFGFFRKHVQFYFIFLVPLCFYGQQSVMERGVLTDYNNALQLFENKAYAVAKKRFKEVGKTAKHSSNLKADAAYYNAMCAIKLHQSGADKLVLSFVADYPNSNKKNKAFFNVANYYFANKKPAYAMKWYQKIDLNLLSKENRKEVNFKMAYAYLTAKKYNLSKEHFLPLINDAKYGNDARYYYGYIAYKLEEYDIAESTLKEIADNKSYSAEISYYLLDISFKSGKFKRCIDVGLKLLETAKRKEQSEISKIVGESYFNLEQYKEAIPYLSSYNGKKGKWNNTDFYQIGYAYYKQNDFDNAINNFNKIIDEQNDVAQNAYYQLGESYLKLDKKTEALNAFKSASEMDFNQKIKEDAALNYAKLSYEEGNPFKSVALVLQDYLRDYPKSLAYNEINELVVSSFIHQQDFEGALNFLKKKKTSENNALALEVSLYRAMELFGDKKHAKALPYFVTSSKSSNPEIKKKALYWEAETNFRLGNYQVALTKFNHFKKFLSSKDVNFILVDYNIGYSNFKLKKYKAAVNAFKNFLQKETLETKVREDAIIRLGDCYFASSNYTAAIKQYKVVVDDNTLGADYAQYQIGICNGFIGNNAKKLVALAAVVNNYESSSLKDDALYQLGSTYTSMKDTEKAHKAYDRLLAKHPKSVFVSKALVRQGLLYYNANKNELALNKFKKVVRQFPNTPDAIQAVSTAKNIYIDTDNLDAYVNWVKTLKFVNVSNADLDNSTFAVAERKYFESKNNKEIEKSLLKYIDKFPEGIHFVKASFYVGETLFKKSNFTNAIEHYTTVVDAPKSEFSEEALNKLAQIYLDKEDFKPAIILLTRLEQEAYAKENILFAQSNLMKGYYEMENFDAAIEYAKKILQKDKLDSDLEYDAKTIIARASFKMNDVEIAEEFYKEVEKNAIGELKAEALYYNAYFKNLQKQYTESNQVVQNLIANYSAYKKWAVKSYVIMGKNYYGLKDVYQATFVLENVIKNFTQFEDIVQSAQTELDLIKRNEAKTNNSVTPQNKN